MSISIFSLESKLAVVTGGRRGIGKAIAQGFAEAGADVAVCDIVIEDGELEAVAEEIRKLGRRSLAIQTDVTKKAEVDNMVDRVEKELGAVDILVNNAGILDLTSLLELDEDGWGRVIDTNLKSCYLCCQAASKRMIERQRGSIVNIASAGGLVAMGRRSDNAYGVSKAGMIRLTKGLAWDLGMYNIRVNAIAPGWVKTDMIQSVRSDPEILQAEETRRPLGRIAEPSEIANVALFLASDAASYITGETIVASGGPLA